MSDIYAVEEEANLGYDADVLDDAELEALEAMDDMDEGMDEEAVNDTGDVTRVDAEDEETELQDEEDAGEEQESEEETEDETEEESEVDPDDDPERTFTQQELSKIIGKKTRRKVQEVHDTYQPYVQIVNQLQAMFPGMSMEQIQESFQSNATAAEEAAVKKIMDETGVDERVAKAIYKTEQPTAPPVAMPSQPDAEENSQVLVDRIVQEAKEIMEDNPDFDVAAFMEENPEAAREVMEGRWLRDIVSEKTVEKQLKDAYQRGRKEAFKAKQKAKRAPKPVKTGGSNNPVGDGYLSDKSMKELDEMVENGTFSDEAVASRLGF